MLQIQRHGLGIILLLIIILPDLSQLRIGEIALVEDFDTGLIGNQSLNKRVGTTKRNTRVQYFNNQIDQWQRLNHLVAGLVHMAGIPMYGHAVSQLGCVRLEK